MTFINNYVFFLKCLTRPAIQNNYNQKEFVPTKRYLKGVNQKGIIN